jgi:class 3 adenylate cyclase/tetratricopeptide (TPR) repeat protein
MAATENVTVLFTDLVGSTELASSLSPEAGDQMRRTHFSTLRQAIATSGGTEVKNLGDGLMVVFSAASAALSCAVAMQQGVARDNRSSERLLGLRVGISAGEASREGDDYFGDPVIEAARLCARAAGGQILAADLVRANAGRRSTHVFTAMGTVELKGLPDPLETLEIGWEPRADDHAVGRVPLPVHVPRPPGVGVVGRAEELDRLESAAKAVAAGEGRAVVLVAGEPGQGKTTLVAELCRRAYEQGCTVLLGRCDEEVGAPYRPFFEALTHYVAHADEAVLRAHVASHGAELARLIPALSQRLGDLPAPQSADADTERYLLYGAIAAQLDHAGTAAPVVLVLEDMHWADKPSLQLLRHVVANTALARLLIICTYRDAELSATHPLSETLGALHRETGISSVALKGFDDIGVIAFMEATAGHDLDEAGVGLAHQLYRETDGNPYFVSEVLRNLSETGAIVQDESGRWSAAEAEGPLALPHSVRAVIGSRLARLGDEAVTVLAAASVIGRDFDLDLVAEVSGVDEDAVIDLLDHAQHATLVKEVPGTPGRYSFSHALVQHTLYEDLGPTKRTRMHRHVGEAIERLYGGSTQGRVAELARHFFLATRPADVDKAITYARQAGEAALEALAPDEAVRYFSQALELALLSTTLEPTVRIDLLIALGTAQRQAGTAGFRETLLEAGRRARDLGDTGRLVSAALTNNRGWFSSLGQLDTEKVELLEAALDALSDTDSAERARLLATLCSEVNFHSPTDYRLALADAAMAIVRRLDDPAAFVDVVARCSTALNGPSLLDRVLADTDEAINVAKEIDEFAGSVVLAGTGCGCAIRAGQFELARERLATTRETAEYLGQPFFLWDARYFEASDAMVHGDPERAERLASEALEIGTAGGQPDALAYFGVQLVVVRLMQGRAGELVQLIADAVEQNPAIPSFKGLLSAAHLHAGDVAAARDLVDQAAAGSFSLPDDVAWFDGMLNYAQVVIELDLPDHAETLAALLTPFRAQVSHSGISTYGPVAMYLGGLTTVLGHYDEAESYFAEAADLNHRGQMKFAEASSNLLWGRMLCRRGGPGDAQRARTLLEAARASAAVNGYAMVERRANADLEKLI